MKILYIFLILFSSLIAEQTIKVGMSTVLSGPAKSLGTEMKLGVESYFHRINEDGGINGKKLELITLDDGYEPKRAAPNVRELINKEKVIALIGNVGTPTAITTVPIANETKTLLFGAFTGAGVLRKNPPDRYVINYRASYAEETAVMIKGLLNSGIKINEIAFFTQNDGYGDAGFNGAIKAIKEIEDIDENLVAHGRYQRNTLNVEDGLSTILDAETDFKAFIMVGAYAPCAKFIKLAKRDFPEAYFLNVSFVGSHALAASLGKEADRVIVTQVVPHYDSTMDLVTQYHKDMKKFSFNKKPGFISLEGYIAAKIFVEGLKNSQEPINRESIIDGIENLGTKDIGIDTPIHLSKTEHQASHNVWPTILKKGKFVPFDWSELNNKGIK